jgi:hypothetical protein
MDISARREWGSVGIGQRAGSCLKYFLITICNQCGTGCKATALSHSLPSHIQMPRFKVGRG